MIVNTGQCYEILTKAFKKNNNLSMDFTLCGKHEQHKHLTEPAIYQ